MFKRFTLSLILILFCSVLAQAQLTKGTRFLGLSDLSSTYRTPLAVYGGIGGAAASWSNGPDFYVFQFSPQIGSFVSDHVLVGGDLFFNYATFDFDFSQTSIGAIPFVRYYFNPESTSGTYFFGELALGYVHVLSSDEDFGFAPLTLGGGVTHMLAPNIGLDGFVEIQDSDITEDASRALSFGARLNIFLNRQTYYSREAATPGLQTGTMMVGGSSGLLSVGLDGARARSFSVEPQFFYFLNPQLAVGTGLLVGFGSRDDSFLNFSRTDLGLSPQVRYYLNSGERKLFFLGAGLNIDYGRTEIREDPLPSGIIDRVSSETTVDFAVGAGFNSFLARNVALEIGPSIRIDSSIENVRLGIDLGVQVFLNTME